MLVISAMGTITDVTISLAGLIKTDSMMKLSEHTAPMHIQVIAILNNPNLLLAKRLRIGSSI